MSDPNKQLNISTVEKLIDKKLERVFDLIEQGRKDSVEVLYLNDEGILNIRKSSGEMLITDMNYLSRKFVTRDEFSTIDIEVALPEGWIDQYTTLRMLYLKGVNDE